MDSNPISNSNSEAPTAVNYGKISEPTQNQAVAEPVTEMPQPSLAKRLHLKLFSLLVVAILIIFAILYYRNHPLPAFLTSQADRLPGALQTSETLRSSIIIQDEGAGSTENTQRMMVESVGRSETTYRLVTVVPEGVEGDAVDTIPASR